MGDCFQHALRRTFQQVRQPNEQNSFAQANGVVYVGERVKLNVRFGHGGARPKLAVAAMEDFLEVRRQGVSKLSWRAGGTLQLASRARWEDGTASSAARGSV